MLLFTYVLFQWLYYLLWMKSTRQKISCFSCHSFSLSNHPICPDVQTSHTSKYSYESSLTYFVGGCNVYRGWAAVGNGHYKVAKIVLFFDVLVSNGNNGILLVGKDTFDGRNTGSPASQVSSELINVIKVNFYVSPVLTLFVLHNITLNMFIC